MTSVLVVDDDPDIRDFIVDLLELNGYLVDTAEHGGVALEKVRQARPDLLLLDMMMPIMDGWAFLHECRRDHVCRCVPVVIVSAAATLTEQSAEGLGVKGLIHKPFELDELLATVERLIPQP